MAACSIGCAVLLAASGVQADQTTVTTGSPSVASSTVSPTTVSDALNRSAPSESSLDLSLGTSIASGDFGTAADTRIWSTALGVRYATGSGLRLSLSVPYMRIRSKGTIFTGIDSTPIVVAATSSGRRVTTDGLGDLTLGASYTVSPSGTGLEIELSGRVKLPTATRKSQLSSQKTDYSGGLQVTKSIGRIAPFASVTYRVFGDPKGLDLRNGFAASAGASAIVGSKTVLLVSYHYALAATRFVDNSHELFAGASTALGESRFRLTGFVTKGLSNGAASVSGGVAIAMKI